MKMRQEEPPVYSLKADAGPSQKGLMRFQIEVCKILFLGYPLSLFLVWSDEEYISRNIVKRK